MGQHSVHVSFPGRLVMVGCGSIGQGVLPLILRHIDMPAERITIVTADARGRERPRNTASASSSSRSTRDNYRELLSRCSARATSC